MSLDIIYDFFFSGQYALANNISPISPERWNAYLAGEFEIETISNVLLEFGLSGDEIARLGKYFGELRAKWLGWFD